MNAIVSITTKCTFQFSLPLFPIMYYFHFESRTSDTESRISNLESRMYHLSIRTVLIRMLSRNEVSFT